MKKDVLSKNIIMYRKKKGLTQKQLADQLNYSDKVISKWERCESLPDIVAIDALAKFFDVSVDQLIGTSLDTGYDDVKKQDKTIELLHTKKPSIILILSILPFIVIWIYTIRFGPGIFAIASFAFSIIIFIYGILVSYNTWEAKYNDHKIIILNKPTSIKLIIDGLVVDQNNAIFKAGIKLHSKIDDAIVNVYLSNLFRIKCDLVII